MHPRFAALLLAATASLAGATATPEPADLPATAARVLTAAAPATTFERTTTAGEAVLALEAAAPGTSWAQLEHRAAVLEVAVDDHKVADLVLHQGAATFRYRVALGALTAGPHAVRVGLHPSLGEAAEVHLGAADVEVEAAGSPRFHALAHAPLVLGREGDPLNDTPLLLIAEPAAQGHRYTLVFSHEDGGTAGPKLLSRWGRRADIEWVYQGDGAAGVYQGKHHSTRRFDGVRRGTHPLLEVATSNNNFAALAEDPARAQARPLFALAPVVLERPLGSREGMLDEHPWATYVSQQELAREGMESPADPATPAVSDLRGYLYVECFLAMDEDEPMPIDEPSLIRGAHLVFEARLADGRTARSDHGLDPKDYGLYRRGWARTSIELPAGAQAADVVALTAQWRGRGLMKAPRLRRARAFGLDEGFVPGPDRFTFQGDEEGSHGHDLELPPAGKR